MFKNRGSCSLYDTVISYWHYTEALRQQNAKELRKRNTLPAFDETKRQSPSVFPAAQLLFQRGRILAARWGPGGPGVT